MSLFITSLQPEVTDSQVIEYIKATFKTESSCEKLKTKFESYSSFKVDVVCDNFDNFFVKTGQNMFLYGSILNLGRKMTSQFISWKGQPVNGL